MALTFYLSSAAGSDNNGGTSEAVVASGSAAATDGTAVVDLSADSPDLSGVTDNVDAIRIEGETGGYNSSDIFKITGHDNGAKTVTVTGSGLPGTASGLAWAIGGPWATPQRAMNVVSSGDHVYGKADGDYTDDSDSDGACMKIKREGSASQPIVIEGYKTMPGDADAHWGDDDYRMTIDGTAASLTAGVAVDSGLGAILYYVFKNIRTKNCSGQGFNIGQKSSVTLENCRGDQNYVGLYHTARALVEGCSFDNNDYWGVYGCPVLNNCDVFNNANHGIVPSADMEVGFCRVYGNGGNGFDGDALGAVYDIHDNTFDGDGKPSGMAAITLGGSRASRVVNNIFHDFETGVKDAANQGERHVVRNNLYSNCTTPRYNFPEGTGDIERDDPQFVDEANHDYRLGGSSPARGAGYPDYMDIGAEQSEPVSAAEIHLLKALAVNKRSEDLTTGTLTIYEDDDTTILAKVTPSISGGVLTLTLATPNDPTPDDPVTELHQVKAVVLNTRLKTLATGALVVKEDDGETTLLTLTPTTVANVTTVESS